MQQPVIVLHGGPSLLVRVLWFVFIGWWLGLCISVFAWCLELTVLGLPAALWLINRLPGVMTLRPQEQAYRVDEDGVLRRGKRQRAFLARAVYFVFVGIWFSGLWMFLAYVATASILLLPVGFTMYGRVGAVTTLYRS